LEIQVLELLQYRQTCKPQVFQIFRLKNEVEDSIDDNRTERIKINAINLSDRGKDSFEESKYYSAASYCFGSNVEFGYLDLLNQDLSEEEIVEKVHDLRDEIEVFDKTIENEKIKTITDLESYMIVKERLKEANDFLNLVFESISNKNSSLRNLAYANERISSARSWSQFFQNTGKEFDLNDEIIKNACRVKISEVEERFQYVQLYFPQNLENSRKELEYAYQDLKDGNYELCLFKASKAKANVDTILSVFGVRASNVDNVVNQKLNIVERNLVEENEKGVFPILGYSYYEYANSLKDSDPFSALLYSSYALELSNLDIYFKDTESSALKSITKIKSRVDNGLFVVLIIGIIIGIIIGNLFKFQTKSIKAKKSRKKRKK